MQSHGQYREVWVPPKTAFIRYEKSDEAWGRYAGVGTIEKQLRPYYDVRDERGSLVGYTDMNPCDHGTRPIELRVPTDLALDRMWYPFQQDPATRIDYKTVSLRVWTYEVEGERFLCWSCNSVDAGALIQTTVIKLVDRDRRDEYIHKVLKDKSKLYPWC